MCRLLLDRAAYTPILSSLERALVHSRARWAPPRHGCRAYAPQSQEFRIDKGKPAGMCLSPRRCLVTVIHRHQNPDTPIVVDRKNSSTRPGSTILGHRKNTQTRMYAPDAQDACALL